MANIHEGRLVLLLFGLVLIPVYFILFFVFYHPDISFLGEWQVLYIIFVNPVMYIIAWELWLVLYSNRIADSYERMKNIVSFISIRYNLYYGFTALFFIFLMIFPLVTPVVASLILGSVVWRLFTSRHDWEKDEKTPAWIVIAVIVVMVLPLICNAYFYIAFIPEAWAFWNQFVGMFADHLSNIARAMATAVILGSIAYLFRYGTSEYELVFTSKQERPKEIGYIRGLQAFLFVLFVILIYIKNPLFEYIQYLAIALNVIVILGNLRKSKQISSVRRSVFSYILVMILFIFSVLKQAVLEGIILVISSLVYLATFLYVFITTPDE
ncbi:MAG: hypothetical protein GYA24_09255 [Candidatus Lokiarchaeota archaeon]|nr:hypothetical protein [Candidatus Lokiarchaeota archaeon]